MMIIAGKKHFGAAFKNAAAGGIEDEFDAGPSTEVNWDEDETTDDEKRDQDTAYGTSSILGKSYKPKTRHKMTPQLPNIKHNQSQVCMPLLFSMQLLFSKIKKKYLPFIVSSISQVPSLWYMMKFHHFGT